MDLSGIEKRAADLVQKFVGAGIPAQDEAITVENARGILGHLVSARRLQIQMPALAEALASAPHPDAEPQPAPPRHTATPFAQTAMWICRQAAGSDDPLVHEIASNTAIEYLALAEQAERAGE